MSRTTKARMFQLFMIVVTLFGAVSCAGVPDQGNERLNVSLMSLADLKKQYGTLAGENPFLSPTGLFQRTKVQFFVIKFEGNDDYINIESVRVRFGDTYVRTTLYGPLELKTFWEARDAEPDERRDLADYNKKYRTIERSVADPRTSFKVSRNHSKVVVAITEIPSEEIPTVELRFNNGLEFFERFFELR